MMHDSDPLALSPSKNTHFAQMKERTPLNQVISSKVSGMQRILQVAQKMALKSCSRALQAFCCPLDSLFHEKVACCPAQHQQPTEDKTSQAALWSPASTVLIVNISNSTLIDCAIGSEAYPSAATESQPLMREFQHRTPEPVRCSCSHKQQGAARPDTRPPPEPPEPPEPCSINIHSSRLSFVIIGDNNHMQVERADAPEAEEPHAPDDDNAEAAAMFGTKTEC